MLTGAEMSRGKGDSRQARISICRRRESWPLLFWYLVIMHEHGIEMRIRGVRSCLRNGSLIFSSNHMPLLVRSYNRWYRGSGKRLPLDIQIDRHTACIVMTGALRRWAMYGKKSKVLRLPTPPCHQMSLAGLTSQVNEHLPVIKSKLADGRGKIMVPVDAAIDYVSDLVPRVVWDTK